MGRANTTGCLATSIRLKMKALPTLSSGRCIYRVPEPLRAVKYEAYTPAVVSIGPYHRKEPKLHAMEIHKLKFLKTFLLHSERNGNLNIYLNFVRNEETKIRECYADPITDLSREEFIEMVLVDSAFIIELFRRCCGTLEAVEDDNFIFGRPNLINHIVSDISMAENQLPFFVIQGLYDRAFRPNSNSSVPALTKIVRKFYHGDQTSIPNHIDSQDGAVPLHLLDLLRSSYEPSLRQKEVTGNIGDEDPWTVNVELTSIPNNIDSQHGGRPLDLLHLLGNNSSLGAGWYQVPSKRPKEEIGNIGDEGPMGKILCPSITRLWEAGIKFQVAMGHPNMSLDIHFDGEKGVLTIPEMIIADTTGLQLRNLIAFEQCHYPNQPYISEYQFLMDCLINTSKDVELLVKARIIKNWLGSDGEVSDLLNNLGMQVSINPKRYYYADLALQLKAHCNKRWNIYLATLKHTYFKHPWAVVSVIYAIVLLILTIVQVITGILSVPKARP